MDSENTTFDIIEITAVIDQSIQSINHQKNFFSYFLSDIKEDNNIAYKCLKDNGALYNMILNIYAIYESTVKDTLLLSLELIEKENYSLKELKKSLRILYFNKEIKNIRKIFGESSTKKSAEGNSYFINNINNFYDYLNEDIRFETSDDMIDTKSNLKYDVFETLIGYFGDDISAYKDFKKWINSLVHHRNNVAHGNTFSLNKIPSNIIPLDESNYEELCTGIISFFKIYKDRLYTYIKNKNFLV